MLTVIYAPVAARPAPDTKSKSKHPVQSAPAPITKASVISSLQNTFAYLSRAAVSINLVSVGTALDCLI